MNKSEARPKRRHACTKPALTERLHTPCCFPPDLLALTIQGLDTNPTANSLVGKHQLGSWKLRLLSTLRLSGLEDIVACRLYVYS